MVLANGAKGDDEIIMKARGMNAQERERKRKLDEEAKRDVMLMGIATISIMAFLGFLMVSRAYLVAPQHFLGSELSTKMRVLTLSTGWPRMVFWSTL